MGKLSDIIDEGVKKFIDVFNNQYLILVKDITANIQLEGNFLFSV